MKKILKIIGILLIIVLLTGAGGFIYLKSVYPKVSPASNEKVEITSQRIERGNYLANHVTDCIDCHSTRNWEYFSGPTIEGTEGKGGEVFSKDFGFPGTFYSKNITPSGIGNWTDGELIRAITCGVNKDGEPLFDIMPFEVFGTMDKEDIYSIVAYIRTLKPIPNDVPVSKPDFPFSLIMRTIPNNAIFQTKPDKSNKDAYNAYVMNSSGCIICHTKSDHGKPIKGMEYAGGWEFPIPGSGIVRSSNITPDSVTGIGKWTREFFIMKFKNFDNPEKKEIAVKKGNLNTIMPWTNYAGMTEDDLGAIYDFLRTVKPVKNSVDKFTSNPSNTK